MRMGWNEGIVFELVDTPTRMTHDTTRDVGRLDRHAVAVIVACVRA